jgi:chromosomal replication initiation ATPase DnaA
MTSFVSRQMPLALPRSTARGSEDFLVAPSNRLAVDWIERWPDWPGGALVVVGPPGSGKSHLAGLWRARSGADILAPGAGVEGAMRAAEAGAVLVEDADRLAGTSAAETALLHLYNALRLGGGTLLITARTPPSAWGVGLPDLSSRLNAAIVARIEHPDDALLRAVALKLFADRQLAVREDVISVLVTLAERSFDGIAAAIARIDDMALDQRREISAALARDVLRREPSDP